MLRVTVSVHYPGETDGVDLDLPGQAPSGKIAALVMSAYGPLHSLGASSDACRFETWPDGKPIPPDETLLDAGVVDGADLRIACLKSTFLQSESGQVYACLATEIWIGRRVSQHNNDETSFINLGREPDGDTVSRQRALLFCKDEAWHLAPGPNVLNLTYVNEHPLEGTGILLQDGDHLQMGGVRLTFRMGAV